MKSKVKFTTLVGNTRINIENTKLLKSLIPSNTDISEHIKSQSSDVNKFKAIYREVSEESMQKLNNELHISSSVSTGYKKIIVNIESTTSSKSIPILIIGLKDANL